MSNNPTGTSAAVTTSIGDEELYGSLCTFAVTGTTAHFQGIYLCHTCSRKSESTSTSTSTCNDNSSDGSNHEVNETSAAEADAAPLCVCYNCAEKCHEERGHEVEYIGDGPAYCDCMALNGSCCVLADKSKRVAIQLNLYRDEDGNGDGDGDGKVSVRDDLRINVTLPQNSSPSEFPFVCDVYNIEALHSCSYDGYIKQSIELVKHTRDTHWISLHTMMERREDQDERSTCNDRFDDLCGLEKLACAIFHRHMEAYNLNEFICGRDMRNIGAEWWVQVKRLSAGIDDNNTNTSKTNEAIDLHYDKDEELASAFDIGSFPTLSTVTYLTEGAFGTNANGDDISAPPTLVFAHTHEMINEGPIGQTCDNEYESESDNPQKKTPQMMISYARKGKHLCFDGRLLHGAPGGLELRQELNGQDDNKQATTDTGLRVTFLVNIWLTRRPSRVVKLPDHIRSAIKSCSDSTERNDSLLTNTLKMSEREIENCHIGGDGSHEVERIQLPFVSNDATWIDGTEGEGGGSDELTSELVVSIVPPYNHNLDTVLAFYEKSFEPKLEYIGEEYADYNDDDGND